MYYETRYQMYAGAIGSSCLGAVAIGMLMNSWVEGLIAAIILSTLSCISCYFQFIKPSKDGTYEPPKDVPEDHTEVPDSAYATVADVLSYMTLPLAVFVGVTGYTITNGTGYWIPVVLLLVLAVIYRVIQYVVLYARVLGVLELPSVISVVLILSIMAQYFLMDVSWINSWEYFAIWSVVMIAFCGVRHVVKDAFKKD